MARTWSPDQLAAALTAAGMPVTGQTVRNAIRAKDLPARRNPRTGAFCIRDVDVRARFPSLFLAPRPSRLAA